MLKFRSLMGLTFFLGGAAWAAGPIPTLTLAPAPSPTVTLTPSVPPPKNLPEKERISDGTKYGLPHAPRTGPDGTVLALTIDQDDLPVDFERLGLGNPENLSQVPDLLKTEKQGGLYYWHSLPGGNYCHFHDGDRDWFGWATGGDFHWAFWRFGTFWWRDDYTERWVHWDQGYWRWQGRLKDHILFQVVLSDGHYHLCDAQGIVGDDLMRTGTEEVITEPPEDKHAADLKAENKRRRRDGDPEIGE